LSPVRGIPTSRAYWELRAEQVLNRVFEPEQPIVVEVCETPANPVALGPRSTKGDANTPVDLDDLPTETATRPKTRSTGTSLASWIQQLGRQPSLLLAGTSFSLMVLAAMTLLIFGAWNHSQQAIRQERNLLLMERLRSMRPSSPAANPDQNPAAAMANATAQGGDLPPPPPGEPWMKELASLPASSAPSADVLRVPLNNRIDSPAPAASAIANTPQLVGVVQVPGQSGSAIFQIGGSSTSAAVGENIGSSGWRLRSASGDTAVIEKSGEQRRISISSGF